MFRFLLAVALTAISFGPAIGQESITISVTDHGYRITTNGKEVVSRPGYRVNVKAKGADTTVDKAIGLVTDVVGKKDEFHHDELIKLVDKIVYSPPLPAPTPPPVKHTTNNYYNTAPATVVWANSPYPPLPSAPPWFTSSHRWTWYRGQWCIWDGRQYWGPFYGTWTPCN